MNNTNNTNNYLMHHGVKGMKWGIRKQNEARKKFRLSNKTRYIKAQGEMQRNLNQTKFYNIKKRYKIIRDGHNKMNEYGLLDAGYSKKEAEIGRKWMARWWDNLYVDF